MFQTEFGLNGIEWRMLWIKFSSSKILDFTAFETACFFSMPVHAISVLNDTGIQIKIDSFRIKHTYLQDGFLLSAQTTSTPERERGKINEIEATTHPTWSLAPCSPKLHQKKQNLSLSCWCYIISMRVYLPKLWINYSNVPTNYLKSNKHKCMNEFPRTMKKEPCHFCVYRQMCILL